MHHSDLSHATPAPKALAVERLNKHYADTQVLHDIDLSLEVGGFLVLVAFT